MCAGQLYPHLSRRGEKNLATEIIEVVLHQYTRVRVVVDHQHLVMFDFTPRLDVTRSPTREPEFSVISRVITVVSNDRTKRRDGDLDITFPQPLYDRVTSGLRALLSVF